MDESYCQLDFATIFCVLHYTEYCTITQAIVKFHYDKCTVNSDSENKLSLNEIMPARLCLQDLKKYSCSDFIL